MFFAHFHRPPAPPRGLAALAAARRVAERLPRPDRLRFARASGQTTAEYALVLLGAAAVALMLTAWAAKSGAIGRLFDTVVDHLIDDAG